MILSRNKISLLLELLAVTNRSSFSTVVHETVPKPILFPSACTMYFPSKGEKQELG